MFSLCWTGYTARAGGTDTLSRPDTLSGPDSLPAGRLLDRLEAQQVKRDGFYYAGMFPTLRSWALTPSDVKTDNAIFYTGLIVFTLRQLAPYLRGEERRRCDSIMARGIRSYVHYRNRRGLPSYNFWPSDKAAFFPHSVLLDRFKDSKQITDDLDDTSILDLGSDLPDSTARRLKELMGRHAAGRMTADGRTKRVRNSYRAVRDLPAYSAWFGVKTPIEFDAGVFCNVLYFVYARGLPLDVHDSASIRFLQYILKTRKYRDDPAYASSYYPRSPVLIYHLARLLGRFDIPGLREYKPQLLEDARALLGRTRDPMDRVILGTALIRLGDRAGLPDVPYGFDPEKDPFVFYIANISCLFPNPIRRLFLENPLCIYYFFSPGYNDALLLEYLVLRRQADIPPGAGPSQALSKLQRSH
jgi:hypothetical protein